MSKSIRKPFEATPVPRESGLTCAALEEIGLIGGEKFIPGMPTLTTSVFKKNQRVKGVPVVQFYCGDSLLSYCVELSVFEDCTKQIDKWPEEN